MTLKKTSDLKLPILITLKLMELSKKHTIPTIMSSQKKRTQILLNYFNGLPVSQEKLDKLHKPAQKILENKDRDIEDKIKLLYNIETQFTFT